MRSVGNNDRDVAKRDGDDRCCVTIGISRSDPVPQRATTAALLRSQPLPSSSFHDVQRIFAILLAFLIASCAWHLFWLEKLPSTAQFLLHFDTPASGFILKHRHSRDLVWPPLLRRFSGTSCSIHPPTPCLPTMISQLLLELCLRGVSRIETRIATALHTSSVWPPSRTWRSRMNLLVVSTLIACTLVRIHIVAYSRAPLHCLKTLYADRSSSAQKRLRDLKGRISAQSKRNFVLERDVRYLDSRIALLIQNRMALDEARLHCHSHFSEVAYLSHISNKRSRNTWKRSTRRRVNIQMTASFNNTPISSSSFNRNHDT